MRTSFALRDSALLRLALTERRFDPFEFFDDGPYPEHRAEKDEVEDFVRAYADDLDRQGLQEAIRRHGDYP